MTIQLINESNLQQNDKELLNAALPYIQTFLETMTEFYPFAMIQDLNGIISILSPDINNKHPTSTFLIDLYETTMHNSFSQGTMFCSGIICINVVVHDADSRNAVECRFLHRQREGSKHYVFYKILNGKCIWETVE